MGEDEQVMVDVDDKAASIRLLDLALQTPANHTKTMQSAALAFPVSS
jgi:hypothetical protein